MFIRCAFFKGTIIAEKKQAFHSHWENNLVPLWRAFPNLIELRVMKELESDGPEDPLPLVMAMKFKSKSDTEESLSSKVRWESKNISKKLFEMFDVKVIYAVFAANKFDPIF